jgi:hypothetical protein
MADKANTTRNRSGLLVFALIAAYGAIYLLFSYVNTRMGFSFGVCPLKRITDVPCPSCGGTRAVLALMQGNLHDAFLFNPLVIILLFGAPFAAGLFYRLPQDRQERISRSNRLWAVIVGALVVNWVYLILAGR